MRALTSNDRWTLLDAMSTVLAAHRGAQAIPWVYHDVRADLIRLGFRLGTDDQEHLMDIEYYPDDTVDTLAARLRAAVQATLHQLHR